MDLRNYNITMGELLDHPQSRQVLQRHFGSLLSHPLVAASRKMSLRQVVELASNKLPKETLKTAIEELKQL